MTKRVLVTGATGFVGSALCDFLAQAGYDVRVAVRTERQMVSRAFEQVTVGSIDGNTDWQVALRDVQLVLHAAARAHVLGDTRYNAQLYMHTNADGTRRLADAAAAAGVQRLVFMSSIKVNGEDSGEGIYGPDDLPDPGDPYGQSKAIAERSLRAVAERTGMQTVCVRSPLVYGPGVRANFLRLLEWIDKGKPLPFGAVCNRRSLVSIWNLCDLLVRVLDHPDAANRTWMVCDAEALSTPELIRRIGGAMNRSVRLLSVPPRLLRIAGVLAGKKAEMDRLCSSLVVDATRTHDELQWRAPVTVNEGLARTVNWYLREE